MGNDEADACTEFPMVVPTGKPGTGDPAGGGDTHTEEWDFTGPGWDDDEPDADC